MEEELILSVDWIRGDSTGRSDESMIENKKAAKRRRRPRKNTGTAKARAVFKQVQETNELCR
jgi:hypothetical protein